MIRTGACDTIGRRVRGRGWAIVGEGEGGNMRAKEGKERRGGEEEKEEEEEEEEEV